MSGQEKNWAKRTEQKYPVTPEQLQILVEAAGHVPSVNLFLSSHVQANHEKKLHEMYRNLHGKTLSMEGIFGILPGLLKQQTLSATDMVWFSKVGDYYSQLACAVPMKADSLEYIDTMRSRAGSIRETLKEIQARQVTPPG